MRKTRKVTVDDTKATCYNGQESERYQKTQHLNKEESTMRRKQLFAVLMAGSMAASLAACGKTDTKKTTAATEEDRGSN